MKPRKLALGNRNIVGSRVTQARLALGMKQVELLAKLQLAGVDMSVPALSLLEGQKRMVSDIELSALADILNVSVDWLLGLSDKKEIYIGNEIFIYSLILCMQFIPISAVFSSRQQAQPSPNTSTSSEYARRKSCFRRRKRVFSKYPRRLAFPPSPISTEYLRG